MRGEDHRQDGDRCYGWSRKQVGRPQRSERGVMDRKRYRSLGLFFLICGYLGILAAVFNIGFRFGLITIRLPGLHGFAALWIAALAAALCFACAWYIDRIGRARRI